MKRWYLFLFILFTVPMVHAMEEADPVTTVEIPSLENLPRDMLSQIMLHVVNNAVQEASTIQEAYDAVMNVLMTNKDFYVYRSDKPFMKYFIDQLYNKFVSTEKISTPTQAYTNQDLEQLDNAIDIARVTKDEYALARLREWLNATVEDMQLYWYWNHYLLVKFRALELDRAHFLLKHIFIEAAPKSSLNLLLERYIDNFVDNFGLWGQRRKILEGIDFLLKMGADINGRVDGEDTPLTTAIRRGQADVARYLIKRGADVNKPGCDESTPLMDAVDMGAGKPGMKDVVRDLLLHGAHTMKAKRFGVTVHVFDVADKDMRNVIVTTEREIFEKKLQQLKSEVEQSAQEETSESKEEIDDLD